MTTSLSAANVQNCEKEQIMNKQITVLYERLSVDDGTDAESNSIANQKQLLSEYAERNNLPNPTHMWEGAVIIEPTRKTLILWGFGGLVLFLTLGNRG